LAHYPLRLFFIPALSRSRSETIFYARRRLT